MGLVGTDCKKRIIHQRKNTNVLLVGLVLLGSILGGWGSKWPFIIQIKSLSSFRNINFLNTIFTLLTFLYITNYLYKIEIFLYIFLHTCTCFYSNYFNILFIINYITLNHILPVHKLNSDHWNQIIILFKHVDSSFYHII